MVKEDSIATSMLFICIICTLMSRVSQWIPGVPLGKHASKDVKYADDTLFSKTANQLSKALCIFNEEAKKPEGQKISDPRYNLCLSVMDQIHHPSKWHPSPLCPYHFGSTWSNTSRDLNTEVNRQCAFATLVT